MASDFEFLVDFEDDFEDDFGGCPSIGRSSSTSNSFNGPYTPKSSQSSPSDRFRIDDVGSSLNSTKSAFINSVPFDSTSLPTVTSAYCSSGVKAIAPNFYDVFNHRLSVISMREPPAAISTSIDYNTMLGIQPPSQDIMRSTPSYQPMDLLSIYDPMSMSPFIAPSPVYTLEGPTFTNYGSVWPQKAQSPIAFLKRESRPVTPIRASAIKRVRISPNPSILGSQAHRHLLVCEAEQKTTELHRIKEQDVSMAVHLDNFRIPQSEPKLTMKRKNRAALKGIVTIEKAPRGSHACGYTDCSKSFKRMEHLKRHERTAHGEGGDLNWHKCPFCENKKPFNRLDNYIQHLGLHVMPRRTYGRIRYAPEAAYELATLRRGMKRRSRKARPPELRTPSRLEIDPTFAGY